MNERIPRRQEDIIASGESERFDFEAQFAHREHFEVAGGNAEVVDITPGKLKDETPVFLAPAWGLNVDVYKRAIETLSERERRVISLSHPRRGGNLEAKSSQEEMKKYPQEELRKAYNILGVMEQKNVLRVDAIAHSEAGINVTIAAVLHPERFRNIVYYAPAGLIGKDTFTNLLSRFSKQERGETLADIPISEAEKETGAAAHASWSSYLRANPLRAIKEAYEISQSEIHEMIRYLHQKGIGIVVASGIDDPVFPTHEMQKIATFDMIDGFLSMRGGHGGIGDVPEEFMVKIEEMLSALEQQREHAVDGVKPDLLEEFK
jgi:pimeloyl-ACP methyl ester carboxylesterase